METICQSSASKSFDQAGAPLKSDTIEKVSVRAQQPVEDREKIVVQARSSLDRQLIDLQQKASRSGDSPAKALQTHASDSTSNAEPNVKIKRCKHGRIIVKDRLKKKRGDELDASSQQALKRSLADDYELASEHQAKSCSPIENPEARSSPLPASNPSNIESKTVLTSEINASPNYNNNDSTHASHEPITSPSRSDKAASQQSAFKSTTARSPETRVEMQTSRDSPRTSAHDDDGRRKDQRRRASPQRATLRSPRHRGNRSKSPRHRDQSHSPPRRGSGTHKDRKARTSSNSKRSNYRSPPTESKSRRRSSRSRSPRRRRTRDRSRSRDSRRLYLHSRHSSTKLYNSSPELDPVRRSDGSHIDHYKHDRTKNDYRSHSNVEKPAITTTSSNAKLSTTLKINSNQGSNPSRTDNRIVGVDKSSIQEPHHLQPINQFVPTSQNLNTTITVCPESSPHRTISAHSSMVFSSEESNDCAADDVESISSDIYDPEGPIISISPGDSPPISPQQTANNPPPQHSTSGDRTDDDMPSSAVQLNQQEKYLQKLNRQERVVEEVKLALRPHYQRRSISKEQYKDVLRRAVPKICHSKNGEINPVKIRALVDAYVTKMRRRK